MNFPRTTPILLIVLMLASCANERMRPPASQVATTDTATSTAAVSQEQIAFAQNSQLQKVSLAQAEQTQNAPAVTERKIIRNANLTLETDKPEDAGRKIASIAESKGGFVISSDAKTTTGAGNQQTASVTVSLRVPAAQFEAALGEIRQNAARVVQEKVSGQDVTEEFIDLEARTRTKKALEAQFLEIMKQARVVADALEVQRQLAEVRGEIESLEGKRKFLENQTSLSTITIVLQTPTPFAASSTGFTSEIARAFSDGINAALWVVLALVRIFIALLPILILFGLPLWLLIRFWRNKRRRAKLAQQFAQEEKG